MSDPWINDMSFDIMRFWTYFSFHLSSPVRRYSFMVMIIMSTVTSNTINVSKFWKIINWHKNIQLFFFRSILSDPLRRNSRVVPLVRHCSGVSFTTVQLHQWCWSKLVRQRVHALIDATAVKAYASSSSDGTTSPQALRTRSSSCSLFRGLQFSLTARPLSKGQRANVEAGGMSRDGRLSLPTDVIVFSRAEVVYASGSIQLWLLCTSSAVCCSTRESHVSVLLQFVGDISSSISPALMSYSS